MRDISVIFIVSLGRLIFIKNIISGWLMDLQLYANQLNESGKLISTPLRGGFFAFDILIFGTTAKHNQNKTKKSIQIKKS